MVVQSCHMLNELPVTVSDKPSSAVLYDELRSAALGHNGGHPRRKRFENYVSERVGAGRKREYIKVGVRFGQPLTLKNARELGVPQMGFEPCLFCSLSYDHESEIAAVARQEPRFELSQELDIFLIGKPANVSDDKLLIATYATARVKKFLIDTARHQVTSLAGEFFQLRNQLLIRSKQNTRDLVETCAKIQAELANVVPKSTSHGRWEKRQQR